MTDPHKCNCSEVHQGLYELVDQALSAEDCERLQKHIENCPQCRAMLMAEEEFRAVLRQCCYGKAPETLRQRIEISISTVRIERRG